MFHDLCVVTDADILVFVVSCALIGAIIGVGLAVLTRRWQSQYGAKIGCTAMTIIGLAASWATGRLFPDPRSHGDMCGYTPDVVLFPFYGLVIVPITMVTVYALGCSIISKKHHQ